MLILKTASIAIIQVILCSAVPVLCSVGTIVLMSHATGDKVKADETFYIVSQFEFSIGVLFLLPMAIFNYLNVKVSAKRIGRLLRSSDDYSEPPHRPALEYRVAWNGTRKAPPRRL